MLKLITWAMNSRYVRCTARTKRSALDGPVSSLAGMASVPNRMVAMKPSSESFEALNRAKGSDSKKAPLKSSDAIHLAEDSSTTGGWSVEMVMSGSWNVVSTLTSSRPWTHAIAVTSPGDVELNRYRPKVKARVGQPGPFVGRPRLGQIPPPSTSAPCRTISEKEIDVTVMLLSFRNTGQESGTLARQTTEVYHAWDRLGS